MNLLFVCTGNTCRSPMAEGIFNALAASLNTGYTARSCGTSAFEGDRAAQEAILAAEAYGADIRGHRARCDSEELCEWADMIICMTDRHRAEMAGRYPGQAGKMRSMSPQVPDPYGQDLRAYMKTADILREALEKLL